MKFPFNKLIRRAGYVLGTAVPGGGDGDKDGTEIVEYYGR